MFLAVIQQNWDVTGGMMRGVLAGVLPIGLKVGAAILVVRLGLWYMLRLADQWGYGGRDRWERAQGMEQRQRGRYRRFLRDWDEAEKRDGFVLGDRSADDVFSEREGRRRRRQWGF